MSLSSPSFGIRSQLLTVVVLSAVAGVIAAAIGSIWLAIIGATAAVMGGWDLTRRLAKSLDALSLAARLSANTGCIAEEFPAGCQILEVDQLADSLNCAARSVHHSQADLDRANLQFIETMAQVLDARDPYTAGHSLRVGAYAYAIARAMEVPAVDANNIRIAAQLHDIGKVGIPDAILQKPGKLTAEEFGLIKLHPQIGRRILEKMGRFREFLPVIELHHENHNGTGYPYKLSGEAIPLAARIVHVADAFDSMVTTRHYRDALSLGTAVGELRAHSGTQFDPQVVEVMLRVIEEGKIEAVLLPALERQSTAFPKESYGDQGCPELVLAR